VAEQFVYKAKDMRGNLVTGEIEGESVNVVVTKLRQMGYVVISVNPVSAAKREISLPFFKRIKPKDLTIFSRQFATMINAGLSLTKCLSILAEQTDNPSLRKVIGEILKDVEAGRSLSDALVKHKTVFPSIFINMVKAGEAGGVLDEVLTRIADYFENESAIRGKIKSAMAYPVAMFSFSMLITFVLITFIVPVFVKMFAQMGGVLPLPTRMLLMVSNGIRRYWFIGLPLLFGIGYSIKLFGQTERGRFGIDSFKLKIPIFGKLAQKMAISRFSRTLGTLITSGVPILQALDIVAESSGNALVARSVRKARASIKEGETIAKPLASEKTFPPMVVQMISVGEETGALDTMLQKISDFYDEEVANMVEALTSLIEPLMIVVMGLIIGGIIIALYMPMFQVITLIK
jgi:type IV pilus assembly protein PilC